MGKAKRKAKGLQVELTATSSKEGEQLRKAIDLVLAAAHRASSRHESLEQQRCSSRAKAMHGEIGSHLSEQDTEHVKNHLGDSHGKYFKTEK